MSKKERHPVEPVYDENVKGSLCDLKQEISSLLGVLTSSVWKANEEHVVVSTTHIQRSTATTRTTTPQPAEAPDLSFKVPDFDQHHRRISPKRYSNRPGDSNSTSSSSPIPQTSRSSPTSITRTTSVAAGVGTRTHVASHSREEDIVGSAFQQMTLLKQQYHAAREEIIRTAATPQTCRSVRTSDAGTDDGRGVEEHIHHSTYSQSRQSSIRRVLRRNSSCQSSLSVGIAVGIQCDDITTIDESKPSKNEVKNTNEVNTTIIATPTTISSVSQQSGPTCPQQCAPLPNLRSGASNKSKNSNTSERSSPAPSSAPIRKEMTEKRTSTGPNSPDPEPHISPPKPTVLHERSAPSHTRAALRDAAHIPDVERNIASNSRKKPPPSLGIHSNPPPLQSSDGITAGKRSGLVEPQKESATRTTRNIRTGEGDQRYEFSTPARDPLSSNDFGSNEVERTIPQSNHESVVSRAENPSPPSQAPLEAKLVTRSPREGQRQSVGERELLALSESGKKSTSGGKRNTEVESRGRRSSQHSNTEKSNHRKPPSAVGGDEGSHLNLDSVSQATTQRTSSGSRRQFESELKSRRMSTSARLAAETTKPSNRRNKSVSDSDLKDATRRASNINLAIQSRRNHLQIKKDSVKSDPVTSTGLFHVAGQDKNSSRRSSTTSISPSRDRTVASIEKEIQRRKLASERRTSSVEQQKKRHDASFNDRSHSISPRDPNLQEKTSLSIQKDIQRRRSAGHPRDKLEPFSRSRSRSGSQQSTGRPEFNEISIPITANILEEATRRGAEARRHSFGSKTQSAITGRRSSSATIQRDDKHLHTNYNFPPRSHSSDRQSSTRNSNSGRRTPTGDFTPFGGSSIGTSPSRSTQHNYDKLGYSNVYEKRKSQQQSRRRSNSGMSDDGEGGPGECPYSKSRSLLLRHLKDNAAHFQHMLNRRDSGRIVTLDEYRALAPLDLQVFQEWQIATQDILSCMLEEVTVGKWKHKPWNFHTFMKNVRRRLQVIIRATHNNENLSSHFRTATGRKYYL